MKEGWKYCELGEVYEELRTGLNPRVHFKLNTEDADGYYITVRELKGFSFQVDAKTDRVNASALKRINERSHLKIGDVLFSGTGTLGRTALVTQEPTWWNIKEGVYAITPKRNLLDSKYLIYAFHSDVIMKKIISRASGTTVKSVPMRELSKIEIPIPPLSEQQRIVSRLDASFAKIDALSKQAEEALEHAKALFQAKLKELMEKKEGWEEKLLGEVGTFKRGGNFSKKDFVEDGFPCIHYGQIHTKLTSVTTKHLSSVPVEIVKTDRCAKKGDLVIAITSEDDAGSCKCTAWMADYEAYVGGHTAIYSHTLDPVFMAYFFQSPSFQKQKLEYTHGFKVVEINPKDIAKIKIVFPTTEEQEQIVQTLDSLSQKIQQLQLNYNQTLANCQALKQAILKETFE